MLATDLDIWQFVQSYYHEEVAIEIHQDTV